VTAVVTGMSVAAPNGLGTEAFWKATLGGISGIGPLDTFDTRGYPLRVAGLIRDFVAAEHVPARLLAQTDRMTRMSLAVADRALADAGLDPREVCEFDRSVVTASSAGGFEFGERELRNLWALGPEHVSVYQSFAWFYAVNAGQISIRHGFRGPSGVLVTEGADGLDAIGQARRNLRDGVRVAVTGGVDSTLCPWAVAARIPNGRLSDSRDPRTAYRPFHPGADGYVPGEGGALVVLEDGEHARSRGARIHGEVAGYAATFDPAPGTRPPDGLGRAIRLALADAGVRPDGIDVVFADASGTPESDRVGSDAIREVFGPAGVPVTAPKTMTGRLCSGAGRLDVVAALLAVRDGVVPHTLGGAGPREDLDLVVGEPRWTPVRTAPVLARGFGGFNAAVVVRRPV